MVLTSVWVPDHAGHAVIVVTSWVAGGWGQKGIGVGKVGLLVASVACSIADFFLRLSRSFCCGR